MHPTTLPMDGGCRCGRVRFRVSAAPLLTMACHCTGCQRMTGGPYSLSAAIPTDGFAILQGETVVGGLRSTSLHHHFCGWCMSWLFTRMEGMDMFVNVRPVMLDDAAWFAPFVETCVDEKLPWASTPAVQSFSKFPPFEAYDDLVKSYAAARSSGGD